MADPHAREQEANNPIIYRSRNCRGVGNGNGSTLRWGGGWVTVVGVRLWGMGNGGRGAVMGDARAKIGVTSLRGFSRSSFVITTLAAAAVKNNYREHACVGSKRRPYANDDRCLGTGWREACIRTLHETG